nr:Ig domain-containing protein [Bordetella bronchiseptica]
MTLTFTADGLPPGLSLDPDTGIISGTLDNSASQGGNNGVYTVEITATDANWRLGQPDLRVGREQPGSDRRTRHRQRPTRTPP